MHPDEGFKIFTEEIYNKYSQQTGAFNEADTRAKIIDYLLRDCLGWRESDISREDNVESGRTDYQLKYQDIPIIVI